MATRQELEQAMEIAYDTGQLDKAKRLAFAIKNGEYDNTPSGKRSRTKEVGRGVLQGMTDTAQIMELNPLGAAPRAIWALGKGGGLQGAKDAIFGGGYGSRAANAGISALEKRGVLNPETGSGYELAGNVLGAGGAIGGLRGAAGVGLKRLAATDIAPTLGSALAGGVVQEQGGGTGSTLAATLAGGMAPSAVRNIPNLGRRIVAGNPQARQSAADSLARSERQNIPANLTQILEGGGRRTIGTFIQRVPGAGALITKQAVRLAEKAEEQMTRIVNQTIRSRGAIGGVLDRGYDNFLNVKKVEFDSRFTDLDRELADILGKSTDITMPVMLFPKTKAKFDDLLSSFAEEPGVMDAWAASPKLLAMGQSISDKAGVSWNVFRSMQKQLGLRLQNKQFVMDTPTGEIKALYKSMAQDMADNLLRIGGKPLLAKHRQLINDYKEFGGLVDDVIHKVGGKTQEQIYAATSLTRGQPDAELVEQMLKPLTVPERELVVGGFFNRLGIGPPSHSSGTNPLFSFERFVNRWNGVIRDNPELQKILFSTPRLKQYQRDMDEFLQIMSQYKDRAGIFRNTSGTAPAGIGMASLFFGVSGLMSGNLGLLGVAATTGAVSLATRAMAWPTFLRWAVKTKDVPKASLVGHFARMEAALRKEEPGRDEEIDHLMQRIKDAYLSQEQVQQ